MKGKKKENVHVNSAEGNALAANAMYMKLKEISKRNIIFPIPYINILHQNINFLSSNFLGFFIADCFSNFALLHKTI